MSQMQTLLDQRASQFSAQLCLAGAMFPSQPPLLLGWPQLPV